MKVALVMLTLLTVTLAGGGGAHKKIIIHVPFKVKHHHHTHTIFKHIHHAGAGAGAAGGGAGGAAPHDDYYEVLGYTYGSPNGPPTFDNFGGVGAASDSAGSGYATPQLSPSPVYDPEHDLGFEGSHGPPLSMAHAEEPPFPAFAKKDIVPAGPPFKRIRTVTIRH